MRSDLRTLVIERAHLQRRLEMFKRYRVPAVMLTALYSRLAELDAQIEDEALMIVWAYQPVGDA